MSIYWLANNPWVIFFHFIFQITFQKKKYFLFMVRIFTFVQSLQTRDSLVYFTKFEHTVISVTDFIENLSPVIPSFSRNKSQEMWSSLTFDMPNTCPLYWAPALLEHRSTFFWLYYIIPWPSQVLWILWVLFSQLMWIRFYLRLPWFLEIKTSQD